MIYICFQNLLLLWQNEYYSTMTYEDCDTQTKLILLPQKLAPHLLLIREFKMDQEWLYIKQSGLWEIQDGHLALPGSLTNLTFIWWDKAFPGGRFDALAMKKKNSLKCFFHLDICSTISSEQGTHFTGQIIQALTKTSLPFPVTRQGQQNKINYTGLNKLLNMITILIFVFRYKEALLLKVLAV